MLMLWLYTLRTQEAITSAVPQQLVQNSLSNQKCL